MGKHTTNQLLVTFARVLKAHAEIVSGAYKGRDISHCDSSHPEGWRPYTDEEKLFNVMGVMGSHIKFMQEILDHAMEEDTKAKEKVCLGQLPDDEEWTDSGMW